MTRFSGRVKRVTWRRRDSADAIDRDGTKIGFDADELGFEGRFFGDASAGRLADDSSTWSRRGAAPRLPRRSSLRGNDVCSPQQHLHQRGITYVWKHEDTNGHERICCERSCKLAS